MSLVSYAESDQDSDSDSSEPKKQFFDNLIKKEARKPNVISKNDGATASVKKEKDSTQKHGKEEATIKPKSIGGLFSSLPAPWAASATWASKTRTKKQQTVKIALPVLLNDSDSDDEIHPSVDKKKISASQKSSGLSSLLPKPKNSVAVKENNPNRPVARIPNRPLIPDSLRRKQAMKNPGTSQNKKQVANHDSDDDEEDDENISFFSLGAKDVVVTPETKSDEIPDSQKTISVMVAPNNSSTSTFPKPSSSYGNVSQHSFPATNTASSADDYNTVTAQYSENISPQNQYNTKDTYGQDTTQYSANISHHLDTTGEKPIDSSGYAANADMNHGYYQYPTDPNYNYTVPHDSREHFMEYGAGWQQPEQPASPQELVKLQGKRRRGEENINIIDVNADDQVGHSNDWKMHYNQDESNYQPQSKEHLPSSQQRKKHQITYLAFQAKEKEWELRNQWARNSQTRRQTQSKYGF